MSDMVWVALIAAVAPTATVLLTALAQKRRDMGTRAVIDETKRDVNSNLTHATNEIAELKRLMQAAGITLPAAKPPDQP